MSTLKELYMQEAYDELRSSTPASPENCKLLGQRKSDRYNEVLRDAIIDPRDHDFARPEQTAGLNIVNPLSRDALLVISYSILACSLHLNTPFLCRIKTRERCLLHFSFLPPNPQRNGTPLFWESTVTLSEVTLIDFVC
jgi:hypothetical protein